MSSRFRLPLLLLALGASWLCCSPSPASAQVCQVYGAEFVPNRFSFAPADVQLKRFREETSDVEKVEFRIKGTLLDAINPRLCTFLVTTSTINDMSFDQDVLDRFPLTGDGGLLSDVQCVESFTDQQGPHQAITKSLGQLPLFSNRGYLADRFSQLATEPLCNDPINLGAQQALVLTGVVEAGVARSLACQSGNPVNNGRFKMIPLLKLNCVAIAPRLSWQQYPNPDLLLLQSVLTSSPPTSTPSAQTPGVPPNGLGAPTAALGPLSALGPLAGGGPGALLRGFGK